MAGVPLLSFDTSALERYFGVIGERVEAGFKRADEKLDRLNAQWQKRWDEETVRRNEEKEQLESQIQDLTVRHTKEAMQLASKISDLSANTQRATTELRTTHDDAVSSLRSAIGATEDRVKKQRATDMKDKKKEEDQRDAQQEVLWTNTNLVIKEVQSQLQRINPKLDNAAEAVEQHSSELLVMQGGLAQATHTCDKAERQADETRKSQIKGMRELKAGWETLQQEVASELQGYDRRLEMLRADVVKLVNTKVTAAQVRQAVNGAEARRIERDLEAARLYADANQTNAETDRIESLAMHLESTINMMKDSNNTLDDVQSRIADLDARTSDQIFEADQVLDRLTTHSEGVEAMLERLRKVLSLVGWTAAAAALGESDAPDPQLQGLEATVSKLQEALHSSDEGFRNELDCIGQFTKTLEKRLIHVEDNTVMETLTTDVHSIKDELRGKVWQAIENNWTANQSEMEQQSARLDVQERVLDSFDKKYEAIEGKVSNLADQSEIFVALENLNVAVEARGRQEDLHQLSSQLEELQSTLEERDEKLNIELKKASATCQESIEEFAEEEAISLEQIHTRMDGIEGQIVSLKSLTNSMSSQSGVNGAPPLPSCVQGRGVQSAGRGRDESMNRLRAQSAKSATTRQAERYHAKQGLYSEKSGDGFSSPIPKRVVKLPSKNLLPSMSQDSAQFDQQSGSPSPWGDDNTNMRGV